MKKYLLLLMLVSLAFTLHAQNKVAIFKAFGHEKDPKKLFALYVTLERCYIMDGNKDDSAYYWGQKFVSLGSQISKDFQLKALLANGIMWNYYVGNNSGERKRKSFKYLGELLELSQEEGNQIYECKANAELSYVAGYFGNALDFMGYAVEAERIATSSNDDSLMVISKLAVGKSLLSKNNIIEAYSKYFEANTIANNLRDSSFKRQCDLKFAEFYNQLKMYKEAIRNIYLALNIDTTAKFHDKTNFLQDYGLLYSTHLNMPVSGPDLAISDCEIALAFCSNKANDVYYSWIGSWEINKMDSYIKSNQIDSIKPYMDDHKEIINTLKSFHQEYKLTIINEKKACALNHYHEAGKQARKLIDELKNNDPLQLFNAHLGLDTILIKQDSLKAVVKDLKIAADISTRHNFIAEELSGIYKTLSDAFDKKRNYYQAYHYFNESVRYADSINIGDNVEKLTENRVTKERERLQLLAKQKKADSEHQDIILYVVILFVVLLAFGSAAWLKVLKSPNKTIVRLCIALSFLLVFELVSHWLDGRLDGVIGDNLLVKFIITLVIGSFLGLLHNFFQEKTIAKLDQEKQGP